MDTNSDKKLKIFRASAGSGKTWRLTVEFLKLIIADPMNYRHILAVTFTNKAAGEMRERAVNELYKISRGNGDSAILAEIIKIPGFEKKTAQKASEEICKRAKIAIFLILHDYSHFRFQTIDTFFQSVLRNLARELGLGSHFNIDLDTEAAVDKAVDQLFDKASNNKELLQWIESYTFDTLEHSGKRDVRNALKRFGNNIFNEKFQDKEQELSERLRDKNFMKDYRRQLDDVIQKNFGTLSGLTDIFFKTLDENGLKPDDFSYGISGVAGYFCKIRKACEEKNPTGINIEKIGTRVSEARQSESKWAAKTSPHFKTISGLAKTVFIPLLNQLEAKRLEILPPIITCELIKKNLYDAGLLCDIADEVNLISREDSRFLLSNTAPLLKAMIGESDAPFVFEKTGIDLHHMMIDEFQDTSLMQWSNFVPLLREGLANGHDSLIVGDTKQSIYRFRNGDWRILNTFNPHKQENSGPVSDFRIPGSDLASAATIETLPTNRRSEINIINFNNLCFSKGLEYISNEVEKMTGKTLMDEIKNAYNDVKQNFPEGKKPAGMVRSILIESDRHRKDPNEKKSGEIMLDLLVKQVEYLQRQGIQACQIAILTRNNKEIAKIADHFASCPKQPGICYHIVSDEAFRLDSSLSVRLLIAALRILTEKEDSHQKSSIPRNELKWLLNNDVLFHDFLTACPDLRRLPLSDAVWEIYKILNIKDIEGQNSYMFSFMDCLNDFCTRESSDPVEFLQNWEEHLHEKTIPLGGKTQGIRILSIHKSKGLQYHTVLVPFCDWALCSYMGTLWCQTDHPVWGQLPLIPVNFSKLLADSFFKEDYRKEIQQQVMDNLNLLYVALTRAEKNLITLSRSQPNHPKSAPLPGIQHLLIYAAVLSMRMVTTEGMPINKTGDETEKEPSALEQFLQASPEERMNLGQAVNLDNLEIVASDRNGEENQSHCMCFQAGELFVESPETSKEKSLQQPEIENIDIQFMNNRHKVGFRQSNRSREFIRSLEDESDEASSPAVNAYIERGKLLHKLFSEIRHPADMDKALFSLTAEGLLPADQQENIADYVREALQDPIASQWWSGDYRLYNECTILSEDEDGHIVEKRPDRVVERDGRIQVIDFKFGQHRPKYVEQVRGYMDLLAAMGHQNIEGYLWYVDLHEIRQVKRHECVILSSSSEKQ